MRANPASQSVRSTPADVNGCKGVRKYEYRQTELVCFFQSGLETPADPRMHSKWVRRITENHTFTENHRKPLKNHIYRELYPPSICFLVVYVYI